MRPVQIFPPPAPGRRRKRNWLLSLLSFLFASGVLLFLGGVAVAGFYVWMASRDLPDYERLAKYEPPVMTRIHAGDGTLMAEYARERRIFVPINVIPKTVIQAFLSAEDKRFYEHGGLDFMGIARALVRNLQNRGKKRPEGASTITQQVAKNLLLSSEQTYDRKLKEAIIAIRMERTFKKEQILELYLNEIYLGMNSYGVAAAALNYFGKELAELTVEEAAYLAALPKGPNNYHPFRKTKEATERRNWILDQMAENGFIPTEQARVAKAKELRVNIRPFGTQIYAADYFAEDVRRTLVQMYGEDGLYGRTERTGEGGEGVNGGLSVRTTLDPRLQKIGRRVLIDGLVAFDREHGWRGAVKRIETAGDWGAALSAIDIPTDVSPWRIGVVLQADRAKATVGLRPPRRPDGSLAAEREEVDIPFEEAKWAKAAGRPAPKAITDVLSPGDVIWVAPKDADQPTGVWSLMQIPEVGGGLVAMDPHTGRVHAVVGGFSFSQSQFDRALQAKRQPGSSYKPFVYAAALDNGYKSTSIVLDAPIEIDQGPGKEIWTPKNYDGTKSYGPSTLRVGIEKSRNQMTVRLAQDMGMPLIVEYSKRFGVYDDLLPVLAMSLGAGETTLVKLAAGYSTFVNGGKQVKHTLIDRIQDRWGKTIWRYDDRECPNCRAERWEGQSEPTLPPDDKRQIIDPHTAYQITSMMQGVVLRGTGTIIRKILPNVPVAGKTGTTNDEKDAWFIGFTPDMVVGVFIGYDTPRPMGKGQTGGHVAAPIFAQFVKAALAEKKIVLADFRQPPGIKLVRVSLRTGLRATPGEKEIVEEAFKPTEEPDDEYSVIGFTNETGTFVSPDQADPRGLGSGRGLW
ncbi:MAG TPA: penicillin-binding protein 1A [Hyphomicrobiaceae bacterium]|jgi:penicillin-binding protein 1A|nr:penicillin-binding protein 1A [Hyphomicrobiaceae bacterium]